MSLLSEYANYDGIRLVLRPAGLGINDYVLEVTNSGTLDLWKVWLELESIIGPSAYGLDDTHMQRERHADRVEVSFLGAGETVLLRRGGRLNIAGPRVAGKTPYFTFSIDPNGETRFGQRVVLEETLNAS